MQAINAAMIDTIAACGDVSRNVVVAANAHLSSSHAAVHAQAVAVSSHMLPKTRAYYEIWLDDEQVAGSGEASATIYGSAYLPRKFTIGFATPPRNDHDLFAQGPGFTTTPRANGSGAGRE